MKKIYSMIIISLLIFACPRTAYADTGIYKTASDLFAAHSIVDSNVPDSSIERVTHDNLPDSVCGYWVNDSDDKHYVVAIQDTKEGNEIKEKILDLIENDSTISFVYQKYSYNYLKQIQDEVLPYHNSIGVVATYPLETENRVIVEILTEKKNDTKTQKILDELSQKYEDAIHFLYVEDYEILLGDWLTTGETTGLTSLMPYFFLFVAAMILLMFNFLIKLKERHLLVLQTTNQKTITVSNQLTTKEVEEMIKKSNISVPQDLDTRILNSIVCAHKQSFLSEDAYGECRDSE